MSRRPPRCRICLCAVLIASVITLSVLPIRNATAMDVSGTISGGTIPSGDEWVVQPGSTLSNTGTLSISFVHSTLTNKGTLNNATGATLTNEGVLMNTGLLTNAGRLDNNLVLQNSRGTLFNSGTMTNVEWIANNSGSTLVNSGTLTNVGSLDNYSGATLTNTGTLVNKSVGGTLANAGILNNATGATLTNEGMLANTGTLTNAGTLTNIINATLNNNTGATLTNTGTLTNATGATLNNKLSATLRNSSGGTLVNAGMMENKSGGTLVNEFGATLTNTFYVYNYGTLTNSGTLTSSCALMNRNSLTNASGGVLTNTLGGTLTNDTGSTLTNAGTLTNASGGWLQNTGTLTNAGTLVNGGELSNGGTLSNAGTLTNASGGVLYNYVSLTNESGGTLMNHGMLQNLSGTLTNGGALTNSGTLVIFNSLLSNAGTLTNSGTLLDQQAIENGNDATLTNQSGGVLTIDPGATLTNDGIVTNNGTLTNSGSIANFGGTFTNTGTLTINSGADLLNNETFKNTTGARLTNAGAINTNGLFDNCGAIDNTGGTLTVSRGGTLNNHAVGTLSGGTLKVLSDAILGMGVGSTLAPGTAYLSSGASYRGLGSLGGTVSINAAHIYNATGGTAANFTTTYNTLLTNSSFSASGSNATLTYTVHSLGSVVGGNGDALEGARLSAAAGSPLRGIFDTLYASEDIGQLQQGVQQLLGEGVISAPALIGGQVMAFRAAVEQQQGRFSGGPGGSGLTSSAGMWSSLGNSGAQNGQYWADNGLTSTLAQILVMNASPSAAFSSSLTARSQVQTIHQGARGGLSGYNGELGLAALGYDTPVTDALRLGVGFGYSGGQMRGAAVTTNLHTWFGSLYGTLDLARLAQLDANLTYAYTSAKLHGEYLWPVTDSTTGRYSANSYSGSLKASHGFMPFGEESPRITPSIALEATKSDRNAFTESGSSLTRRFGASTMNTVDMPVGAALSQAYDWGKGTFSPELSAYYVRRLADTRAVGTVTLLGSSSTSTVNGVSTGRDLWRTNLGGRYTTLGNVDVSLFYNGEFGNSYSNNGLTLELKYGF